MQKTEEAKAGCFQVILLFLLAVNYVIVSMNHALPEFHSHTPTFYCKVKGVLNTLNVCVDNTQQQVVTSSELISSTINTTTIFKDIAEYTSSCETGYRFDSVRGETTIVTEWGLICEKRYLLYLSATLYFAGVVIGSWIAGVLADRVGRLPVLAICLYTQGTLAVALYIIQDYRAFLVVRSLQGLFVQGLQISTFTLLFELFPTRTKTLVGMASQFASALGLALLACLSYVVSDWRVLQLATSVPTAVTVLYIWIVPESPRWLLAKGKLTEAHMALEKISKYNTCCRKNKIEIIESGEHETVDVTTIIESATVTPVKPKRKSRISNVDLNETKANDNNSLPKELSDVLTPLECKSEDKNIVEPSKILESEILNLESQLEIEISQDEAIKSETQASTRPSTPNSSKNDENLDKSSKISEGNQEILTEAIDDEIVELRTTGIKLEHEEEKIEEKKNVDIERKTQQPKNQSFTQFLRRPKLCRNFLALIFLWFSASLCYYGWIPYSLNLTEDRHVNFAISASLDLLAYILTYFVLIKFGRRIPLSIYLILSGCICITLGAVSMPIHENGPWKAPTKLTLIVIGKGTIVSSLAIIYLYTVEIFPTVLRSTGLGYCEIFKNIAALIAPQILLLEMKTSVVVPRSIMGTLCIVSGILSLALPETLNKFLPDTIEQSENLWKKNVENDYHRSPIVRKKANKRQTIIDEQTERDILREKLFSEENGGKTWVDAGNGIIVNFSDNSAKNTE